MATLLCRLGRFSYRRAWMVIAVWFIELKLRTKDRPNGFWATILLTMLTRTELGLGFS